jgi:hypothetical protein
MTLSKSIGWPKERGVSGKARRARLIGAHPNKAMQPDVIENLSLITLNARRVMPGVRRLQLFIRSVLCDMVWQEE